jgi:hypothetical protein
VSEGVEDSSSSPTKIKFISMEPLESSNIDAEMLILSKTQSNSHFIQMSRYRVCTERKESAFFTPFLSSKYWSPENH